MGFGLALVFTGRATTGGTDTLAALLQRLIPHVPVSRILPFLDGGIIALSAWIFGIPLTLYAIVSVVLAGKISDEFTSGVKNARLALIISNHYPEIAQEIIVLRNRMAMSLRTMRMVDEWVAQFSAETATLLRSRLIERKSMDETLGDLYEQHKVELDELTAIKRIARALDKIVEMTKEEGK